MEFHALEHQVIVDADGHYVCGSSFRPAVGRPRARANAALMAAAPEMYAILKRLGQLGEKAKIFPMLALEKTLLDIIEEARRILVKARGEAAE